MISGDVSGVIYIWTLVSGVNETGGENGMIPQATLKTFELHKDKGAITNLVAIQRPLNLFGLTANMNGYDVTDIKPLSRVITNNLPLYSELQQNNEQNNKPLANGREAAVHT